MNDVFEQSESGREVARRNYKKGYEQGYEQGFIETMRAALQARYGELADVDDLARRLVLGDFDGNIARILAGATLAELLGSRE